MPFASSRERLGRVARGLPALFRGETLAEVRRGIERNQEAILAAVLAAGIILMIVHWT